MHADIQMKDFLLWDRVHNTKTLVRSFQDTVTVTASKNQEVVPFHPAPPMQRTVSRYDAWVRGGEVHRAEAAEHHLGLNPNLWVIHARFGLGLTLTRGSFDALSLAAARPGTDLAFVHRCQVRSWATH